MGFVGFKWSDKEVYTWAQLYMTAEHTTLTQLEEDLGVSHSTLYWCFLHRLNGIDGDLYNKVTARLQHNKYIKIRKGE